jgi:hypothetical protein
MQVVIIYKSPNFDFRLDPRIRKHAFPAFMNHDEDHKFFFVFLPVSVCPFILPRKQG